MQRLIFISTLIFLSSTYYGQDSTKCFEFGSTLATVNSFNRNTYFAPERSQFEFINGLFFRYTKKRFAFRALASYSDNSSEFQPPSTWVDAESGNIHNKDFRIGIGAQISFVKKGWLYIFTDLSYRYVLSTGEYNGGLSGAYDKFQRKSNGFESLTGLGCKFNIFKNFYLSPELGYNISEKYVNATNTSQFNGRQTKYSYFDLFLNPIARLHLTLRF